MGAQFFFDLLTKIDRRSGSVLIFILCFGLYFLWEQNSVQNQNFNTTIAKMNGLISENAKQNKELSESQLALARAVTDQQSKQWQAITELTQAIDDRTKDQFTRAEAEQHLNKIEMRIDAQTQRINVLQAGIQTQTVQTEVLRSLLVAHGKSENSAKSSH